MITLYQKDSDKYVVSFTHNPKRRKSFAYLNHLSEKGMTTLISTGASKAHKNDIYSKAAGRKYAFENAVNNIVSRQVRAELWDGYWKAFPNDLKKLARIRGGR